jgi:O-antigen ligase/tetratricopeptide (TPR) repeat protein
MARTPNKTNPIQQTGVPQKSILLICLDYALLVFCLSVLCLRIIYTESPPEQSGSLPGNIGDNLYSLSVSACLLAAVVIWIIAGLFRKNFLYRITGMEIGLFVFSIAVVVSGLFAADKRIAITNIVVNISPLLGTILLVQILDTQAKVKLVLTVIAAAGALAAYQGVEQFFTTNQATIEQYHQNPQGFMEQFGIEPNSLEQFLFEHRLNSKNVSSFFTTRNSAGSFLLMCFFAACALLYEKYIRLKSDSSTLLQFLGCLVPAAITLLCLFLTKSKGAIIGLIFACGLFVLLFYFGSYIKKHTKPIVALVILLILIIVAFIFYFGAKYDSLPGGNSMLVRWQYWKATIQMFAAHPLTGVGPGNFTYFYQQYKNPASIESIADPHNFPLSLLVQYGTLGLVGFLLIIVIPLYRCSPLCSRDSVLVERDSSIIPRQSSRGVRLATMFLILWVCISLAQRIIIVPISSIDRLDVLLYVTIRFYLPPVIIFVVSFLLYDMKFEISNLKSQIQAILFCGLLGVMLHNLTDFAIFEPGVYATFLTIIACLIVIRESYLVNRERQYEPRTISSKPLIKATVITIALLITWAFFAYALLPVARATTSIKKANHAIALEQYDMAHTYFNLAANQDNLSSVAPAMDARLYIMQSQLQQTNKRSLLIAAQQSLQTAVKRNKADYKHLERLMEIYLMLSDISTSQEKTDWLNQAFIAASQAVELYPGSGRLNFSLAQIAEKLGKTAVAIEQYNKAVEIELEYRSQFKKIYPTAEVISRLGQDKYKLAKERIKALQEQ